MVWQCTRCQSGESSGRTGEPQRGMLGWSQSRSQRWLEFSPQVLSPNLPDQRTGKSAITPRRYTPVIKSIWWRVTPKSSGRDADEEPKHKNSCRRRFLLMKGHQRTISLFSDLSYKEIHQQKSTTMLLLMHVIGVICLYWSTEGKLMSDLAFNL